MVHYPQRLLDTEIAYDQPVGGRSVNRFSRTKNLWIMGLKQKSIIAMHNRNVIVMRIIIIIINIVIITITKTIKIAIAITITSTMVIKITAILIIS